MKRLFFLMAWLLCTCPVFAEGAATGSIQASAEAIASDAKSYRWGIAYGAATVSAGTGQAQEHTVSLRHYGDLGSIALERIHLQRFGFSDSAIALDAYPRLWEGAYANVRYQRADEASLYPSTSWRAELFQNVGDGWELSVGHDELKFSGPVRIDGVGLAKYLGNFYLRWRHQNVSSNTSTGKGDRFVIRYYYQGDADHYLETNISKGHSVDANGNLTTISRSDTKGIVWYLHLDRTWGLKVSGSQSRDLNFSGAYERNASATLTYRW